MDRAGHHTCHTPAGRGGGGPLDFGDPSLARSLGRGPEGAATHPGYATSASAGGG
jgi:hypothetical protein